MLLSLTPDEVCWFVEKILNTDEGVKGHEVDPFHMARNLGQAFVAVAPVILNGEKFEDGLELTVDLTTDELWVLKDKVSLNDKTPEGKRVGLQLLYKVYSAILKAEKDDAFWSDLNKLVSTSTNPPVARGDENAVAS